MGANPSSRTFAYPNNKPGAYFNIEDFFNDLTTLYLASNTVKALAVVLVDSSGNQVNPSSIGSTIVDGTTTVTTAGTAVRITSNSTPCKGVWLSGDTVAGILLYVGASTVVGNASGQRGVCIIPGNNPVFLEVNDLNLLWVDAASNGGKLAWAYTI